MWTITLLCDPKIKHSILDRTFDVHVRWNSSVAFTGLKVLSLSGHKLQRLTAIILFKASVAHIFSSCKEFLTCEQAHWVKGRDGDSNVFPPYAPPPPTPSSKLRVCRQVTDFCPTASDVLNRKTWKQIFNTFLHHVDIFSTLPDKICILMMYYDATGFEQKPNTHSRPFSRHYNTSNRVRVVLWDVFYVHFRWT